MARLNTRRSFRALALLCIAVALIAAFPAYRSGAQTASEIQTLDDTQPQFTRGVFQRIALSPDLNPVSSVPADQRGALQLAPIGALKPWERDSITLPNPSADAGVVTIGNRLYVIGGDVGGDATNAVLWANVNQILGNITQHTVPQGDPRYVNANWVNDPLPAGPLAPRCLASLSKRTRVAAAALTTGPNTGFIYVVGGLATEAKDNCDANVELTSATVNIGAVSADGEIVWSTAAALPSDPSLDLGNAVRGVQAATATVVRTSSGKSFLYVIGGLSTYSTALGDVVNSSVEKSVYRAEINTSTGALGAWVRDVVAGTSDPESVPLAPDAQGIYDHTATHVTSTAVTQAGTTVTDGIVIAGGYTQLQEGGRNPFVYRATINPADGDLIWDAKPSTDNNDVTLGQGALTDIVGLGYNNKLYMIGGKEGPDNTTTRDWALTASFDDALNIQPIPGLPQYFIGSGTSVLQPEGRRGDAGAAIMDALPPADNPTDTTLGTAWALVVGGNDQNGAPTTSIFRGRLGGDEALANSDRISDGWYYSSAFNVTFAQAGGLAKNARVLSIRWAAEVNRGANTNADMIVQFRKTLRSDPNCPNDSVFGANDPWFTLDADTGTGFFSKTSTANEPFNTVTLKDAFGSADFVATCFQYRVRFIQNGLDANSQPIVAADPKVSPKLFSMNIEKVVAGNADLRVAQFGSSAPGGRLATLDMAIQNLSLEGRDNTQDAGLDQDGSFFVHLCVVYAPAGQPAPTLVPPTLPLAADAPNPDCFKAYYEVNKWQMTAGAQLALINSGNQTWKRQTGPATEEVISDIRSLFSEPGTYKVAMIIDARNYVNEGTAGELNNRGEEASTGNQPQILTLEITGPPVNVINLPVVRR